MSQSAPSNNTQCPKEAEHHPSAAPPSKSHKSSNQLQINYLARQCADDLPLITRDDTLPNIAALLTSYGQVLDRHESLARNLGAVPLGPILIKRFERCFEAPPKIIASHSKGALSSNTAPEHEAAPQLTWLDIVDFARSHPAQFTLSTFSEGRRVCQFYYPQKQVRVQISEEDFLFISSGRCQDLIPPLPIWEDEEKEVGTCEILEKSLRELTNAADMIAARTRQLSHRLKGRRMAILERRAGEGSEANNGNSNNNNNNNNNSADDVQHDTVQHQSLSTPSTSVHSGFVAVNTQPRPQTNGKASNSSDAADSNSAGAAIRADLLKHFQSLPHNQAAVRSDARRSSIAPSGSWATSPAQQAPTRPYSTSVSPAPAASAPPFPSDPLSHYITDAPRASTSGPGLNAPMPLKHNFSRPLPPALESSQPFRALCQVHMDGLPRGCTKKHARCHWRDVTRDEIADLDSARDDDGSGIGGESHDAETNGVSGHARAEYDDEDEEDGSTPLDDLEALARSADNERAERERAFHASRDEDQSPAHGMVQSGGVGKHTAPEYPGVHSLLADLASAAGESRSMEGTKATNGDVEMGDVGSSREEDRGIGGRAAEHERALVNGNHEVASGHAWVAKSPV
ncbi:hypothetical protein H2203_001897 [Taxawa tesnikishii (nom. ined.)]|nr:hypothetical protein H2203_001897 [Dothideales sp. JES 119]